MTWTYPVIMLAAWAVGFGLLLLPREPLGMRRRELAAIGLGALCGGVLGAKLPFVLADWSGFLSGAAWFDSGKTIVSGLVGGYLGASLAEWALGVQGFPCDRFAAPLGAGIGIGRLACFQAGCCHGVETALPWGFDFGDGLLRHPTQLYESAFHLAAAAILFHLERRRAFRGQLVRFYFLAYFAYRFATEFIRPEPRIFLGLTGYQLAVLLLAAFFSLWCCAGGRLRWPWTGRQTPQRYRDPTSGDHLLKPTRTVCPVCLEPAAGTTYQRDGKVFLRRRCAKHGECDALVCSDRRHYYLRDEAPHQPPEGKERCSPGPEHRTCVGLIEITEACNLHCPVCFAGSPSGGHRGAAEIISDVEAFTATRGPLDVLQLSGGEPLLHPELLEIIDHCRKLPISYVVLNTNGRQLVRDQGLGTELAQRMPRLELNLQLDGLDAVTHASLRGADLLAEKEAVLARIVELALPTTLVCTVVKGINERELGPLVRRGLLTPVIRGITFQPAMWVGRFAPTTDPMHRATVADVIARLVEQSEGLLAEADFHPLPCSNPNCCSFTYIARRRPIIPLTRIVRYEDHFDKLADRVAFDMKHARQCCGGNWNPEDFFRIVVKPFMDAYTYDQDRIDECCVHVIRPGGRAVSFCRFNTLERSFSRSA